MLDTTPRRGSQLGWTTLSDEREIDALEIDGALPPWLAGSLLRTGPAMFEVGDRPLRHWFDGFAMLHRFSIDSGRVSYANRFLRSRAFEAAQRTGRLAYHEFASDPCRTLFRRAQMLFAPKLTDNGSVNVARLGERYLAMTETPMPVVFDPQTLETLDVEPPRRPGVFPTAHPHFEDSRLVGYTTRIGARSSYELFEQAPDGSVRTVVRIPEQHPSYMHSFSLTERYAVLIAQPHVLDSALKLALGGRPFIENYRWRPELGTRLHVIDRRAGRHVGTWRTEPFFCFHTVNAFEDAGRLVLDLVAWDDASVIDGLYLDRLRERAPLPHNDVRRVTIDLAAQGEARTEVLVDAAVEMPRISYARCNGRPYRYAWASGAGVARDGDQRVVKLDVLTGDLTTWEEPGAYPGEPVFVAAPGATAEDEGVVLSIVLDAGRGSSYLLVLHAATLDELARARVPHHITAGLHGEFFAAQG